MEEQLKQRLVGGAVLVSLIVIFLPMLLDDGVDSDPLLSQPRMPEKPKALQQGFNSQTILPEPITAENKLPLQVEKVTQPAPVKPAANTRTGKIDRPTPGAWLIQVASFSHKKNAQKLLEGLNKANLPAELKQVTIEGKRHYRVQILPQLDKKQAQEMVQKIKKKFNLKASLIRYSG